MRLIDADAFKSQIAGMAIINSYPPQKANALCELVNTQPTAYDVDAVLNKLKTDPSVKLYGSCNSDNYLIPVSRTVDIVKGGVIK